MGGAEFVVRSIRVEGVIVEVYWNGELLYWRYASVVARSNTTILVVRGRRGPSSRGGSTWESVCVCAQVLSSPPRQQQIYCHSTKRRQAASHVQVRLVPDDTGKHLLLFTLTPAAFLLRDEH